ncbi:reverse transcriptase domain protein [Colletotrichum truncatum]|uniref:Reverse transcriptase domain protein n=1 Tax=Colletotrichum truncatum TaxID=5467 RepID=A0ACC3YYS3_COLTU
MASSPSKSLCATFDDDAQMKITVNLGGYTTQVLIDSGAQGNFIAPRIVQQREIPWNQKQNPYRLRNVEGKEVEYGGGSIDQETAQLPLLYHGHQELISLDITEIGNHDVILGIPWLRRHNPQIDWVTGRIKFNPASEKHSTKASCGLLAATRARPRLMLRIKDIGTRTLAATTIDKVTEDPMSKIPVEYRVYSKLFAPELETGLPEHSKWDHKIEIKEGHEPTFNKIYPLNQEEMKALDEWLDENLAKGFIRPSKSPAGYPVLFVPKKNGKKRLCVDYRRLNDITIKDCYPLPLISELRDLLYEAQWFTALDLKGAYNLIRIAEGDEWKTAFRTRRGQFETLVMPFGLTNAPATFQTMINQVLREYLDKSVVVYLDDILIFSKTLEEHKKHVHEILKALEQAKLLVEPEKSLFHKQEVEFLGFTITPGVIKMSPNKIKAVQEWPTPENPKDILSFLGFVNFYRKFLKDYSKTILPLTELTKKNAPWEWTDKQQKAFQEVKDKVTSEPVIQIPNPEKPFELETDASNEAEGAQLGQRDENGVLHPCGFFSRKFQGPELNYQIHDKELMAIIDAFKEWRPQLSGTKYEVKVYTDHKNLAHFTTSKELNKRQIRWSEFLSEFNFRIIYRKGSENGRADALSRRPDYKDEVPEETQVILKKDNGDLVPAAKLLMIGDRVKTSTTGRMTHDQIREIHSAPAHGHQGVTKTWKRIRQHHDKRVTRKDVADAIKDCEVCAKSKPSRHKPYGELQPLPAPPAPWHSISLDFIVKLPKSREPLTKVQYDSILVVVDRFTKYAYFIPYLESSTAEDLAYTFLRIIVSQHGLPQEIVSDRGSVFTSKFWRSLISQLGAKHSLSTAFHPQSDGQTERINQILETYLRSYVNYDQDNWVKLLPTAQFAYNSSIGESTRESPFFLNYGFNPTAYGEPRTGSAAIKAVADIKKLKEIQQKLPQELEFVRQRMKKHADRHRVRGPPLKEGGSAYLIRRNIKTKRPSDKLDFKKLGPFEITKKISEVNYELKLPETMKCHPVFHVSLLEPAPDGIHTEDCIIVETDDTEYEVERILDHRRNDETTEYFIKWKNYGHEDDSWEPAKNLEHAQEELQQYWHQRTSLDPSRPNRRQTNPRRQ